MSALIFDRTQADADRAAYLIGKIQRGETLTESEQAEYFAGLKGCYNIADLNRVEAKVRELAEVLRSYGYSVDYKDRTYPVLSYVDTDYLVNAKWTGASGNNYAGFARNLILSGSTLSGIVWCAADSSNNTISFTSYNADIGQSKSYAWNGINDTATKLSSFALNDGNNTISIENGSMSVDENKISFSVPIPIKAGIYEIIINVLQSGSAAKMTIPFEIKEAISGDWQYGDTMLESDVLLYLANIAALRDVIKLPPDVPPIPTADQWISWMAANDIERIVFELDRMIYGIVPLFRRSGTFRAGKNAQHLLLAEGVN